VELQAIALVLAGWLGFAFHETFDEGASAQKEGLGAAEYIFFAALYFAASFTIVYFNSALVSAAYEKLRGGAPTIGSSLRVANAHVPNIFGWDCFSTTIGLALESIRSSDSIVAKILASVLSSIWGYMTFLRSRCWSSRV
jgi:hypothetical protein